MFYFCHEYSLYCSLFFSFSPHELSLYFSYAIFLIILFYFCQEYSLYCSNGIFIILSFIFAPNTAFTAHEGFYFILNLFIHLFIHFWHEYSFHCYYSIKKKEKKWEDTELFDSLWINKIFLNVSLKSLISYYFQR